LGPLGKSEILITLGLQSNDLVIRALILGTGDWGLGTFVVLQPRRLLSRLLGGL
jgi:hypothetical protein